MKKKSPVLIVQPPQSTKDQPTPFTKFEHLARGLFAVERKELTEEEKQVVKQKATKPKH